MRDDDDDDDNDVNAREVTPPACEIIFYRVNYDGRKVAPIVKLGGALFFISAVNYMYMYAM